MKIIKLNKVKKEKFGHVNLNGIELEPQERRTIRLLKKYGFDIEIIRPTNTPKTKNPDLLMLCTIWEMKAPTSFNENTLKIRMKKASKQASHVIFDLRNIKKEYTKAEKCIIDLFTGNSRMRRMILIKKSGEPVGIFK